MRQFTKDDLEELNEWLEDYDQGPVTMRDLPRHGVIIPGVACAFMVSTDTTTCFLDAMVTNKYAHSDARDEAIGQIEKWIKELGKISGYERIGVFTSEPSLVKRAIHLGFELKQTNFGVLTL